MANTGVKGRIVFAGGDQGISGLTVRAYDIDPLSGDDFLGSEDTVDGNFHIKYQPGDYRPWFLGAAGENPDIEVRIYGAGGRLLLETQKANNVTDDPLDLGKIEIHRNNVRVTDIGSATAQERLQDPYWLATHTSLNPASGDPIRLTRGNELEWLVDGGLMFPAITKEIKNATSSVKLINMAFDVDNVVTDFEFPQGKNHTNVGPTDTVVVHRLGRLMTHKSTQNVAVHVLVWDLMDVGEFFNFLLNKLFPGMDTADEVKAFFQTSSVHTDTLETSQLLHIKLVVVDGKTGYVIGSTVKQGYFGDQDHLLRDARHGGLLPANRKDGRGLMHDASLRVRGPAVRHLDQTFTTVSNVGIVVTPVTPAPQQPPIGGDSAPVALQVLRTLPGEMFTSSAPNADTEHLPHGETGILESYQRAIMKAEEYIYIEDQYFTSQEVADAIMERMAEIETLEVILVVNVRPDIGGYFKKQAALINEMRAALGDQQQRLGVFTMWRSDASQAPLAVTPIYVHSKVAIIDDRWASVGTANVDGASLNERQWGLILAGTLAELSLPKKILLTLLAPAVTALMMVPYAPFVLLSGSALTVPSFAGFIVDTIRKEIARGTQHANPHRERQPPRHPELNVVVYNGIAGQPATDKVKELRESLWKEHLGVAPPPARPTDGWLSKWRDAATGHATILLNASKSPPTIVQTECKILEWAPHRDHKEYLKSLKIGTQNIDVQNIELRGSGHKMPFQDQDAPLVP